MTVFYQLIEYKESGPGETVKSHGYFTFSDNARREAKRLCPDKSYREYSFRISKVQTKD